MTAIEPVATWRGRILRAVLFDLDGTLLDTVADIARALNRALQEYGWAALEVSDVRRMIGQGSPILIRSAAAALGQPLSEAEQASLLNRFFHHYGALEETNESDACPYPGALDTVVRLHAAGLKIGVVTNKYRRFADALLHRLQFMESVDVLVGGDTCGRRKPDPEPLLFACAALRVNPCEALMVGDSVNDVRAARAAGIPIVCVPYGYNEGQDPQTLECDAMVGSLAQLPKLLGDAL